MEIYINFSAYFCILSVAFPESLDNVLSQPSPIPSLPSVRINNDNHFDCSCINICPLLPPTAQRRENEVIAEENAEKKEKIRARFVYSSSSFYFFCVLFILFFCCCFLFLFVSYCSAQLDCINYYFQSFMCRDYFYARPDID